MSWYDFLGDINWGSVLNVAAPIVDTYMTTRANNEAAQNIQQSNQQAADILAQNQARAQEILRPVADATRPGLHYLRGIMAQGDRLTPVQQAELTQRTSDFGRSAQRKFNSGRAFTAMADRFYGQNERSMREGNRQQANAAASQLAGQNIGVEQSRATGQNSLGIPTAALAANTGLNTAQANVANAQSYGQGLNDVFGAIRGFIASDEKRKSDYA